MQLRVVLSRQCGYLCLSLSLILLPLLHPGLVAAQETIALVGSGSSVPAPLYARWAEEYNKRSPKFRVRYLPLGTSEGIKEISHGSGDFAAGEVSLTPSERSAGHLIELPSVLIAIVPIYNLSGVEGDIHLSGAVLADIFLGHIKTWDSPAIAKLNPDLKLPAVPIQVVYRPGGKGSNYIFTAFLSKSSAQFRTQIGTGASPAWPVGSPAERSSDMVDKVRSGAGTIGYVEAQYAIKNRVRYAAVLNPAGQYVKASGKTISAACSAVEAPSWNDLAASLVAAPGADSYPIASFSWIYVRTSNSDPQRANALADLLDWTFSTGQDIASEEGYVPLPAQLQDKVRAKLHSLH